MTIEVNHEVEENVNDINYLDIFLLLDFFISIFEFISIMNIRAETKSRYHISSARNGDCTLLLVPSFPIASNVA